MLREMIRHLHKHSLKAKVVNMDKSYPVNSNFRTWLFQRYMPIVIENASQRMFYPQDVNQNHPCC